MSTRVDNFPLKPAAQPRDNKRMHPELPYLNSLLVVVGRRVPRGVEKQIERGELIQVASRRFVRRKDMMVLRQYQRQMLMTLAAAQSVNSSYLVGSSAARVLGMWTVDVAQRITLATRSGGVPPRTKWPAGCVYRKEPPPEKVVQILGAAAVDPVGAWLQIACTEGFRAGLVAADWLLANKYKRSELKKRLDEVGMRKGIEHARRSLREAVDCSDAPGESYARALLIEEGIGPLRPQAKVVPPYAIDLLVRGCVAVEIDGELKYDEDPEEAIRQERRREKLILNRGFQVVRYSSTQVFAQPRTFITDVLRALERAQKA